MIRQDFPLLGGVPVADQPSFLDWGQGVRYYSLQETMEGRFQDQSSYRDDEVEAAIARNHLPELRLVPVTAALLSPNLLPAEAVCMRLARHEDPRVRGNAIMALGHLARRFRSLENERCKAVIESGLKDAHEYVRVHAASAADEVHQFLGWNMDGHDYGA